MLCQRNREIAAALFLFCAVSPSTSVAADERPGQADLASLGGAVSLQNLKATIATLVSFGTRHTMSDTASPSRGIGAARRWVQTRFQSFSTACGGCLVIETPEQTVTGARIPRPTIIQDIIAIQRGTNNPDRIVIISGHIDSRITDVMDFTHDAPGANDDGSGTAAVMEAARILSKHSFPATIVYAVLSGEEQGLYGGKVLADYAKRKGWRVEAVLNNDIIGNTHGLDGRVEDTMVRVFSEGTRGDETPALAAIRRSMGGELDSPSRNLARFMARIAAQFMPGFSVRQILRADRFGRGGDQAPMQEAGYPAVRVTEADENYTRQHQNIRIQGGVAYGDVIEGVDFSYLGKVTELNVLTLAALATAPPPPTDLKIGGAVAADTTLSWAPSPSAASYRVWWRETTDPAWTHSENAGPATKIVLKGVNIDDYSFGVSAVSADGAESPVEFPGPVGEFTPPGDTGSRPSKP
jgi:Zn-dependent M28 family amino/carboxypeptidase